MNADAPLRVLVVDDDPDCREILVDLVGFIGHEVESAATGSEGLRKAAEFEPDVVILDLHLPDVGGWEVARTLSAAQHPPLLVATTGSARDVDRTKAWHAGFDVFLLKPFRPDALEDVLQDERRLRRRLGSR